MRGDNIILACRITGGALLLAGSLTLLVDLLVLGHGPWLLAGGALIAPLILLIRAAQSQHIARRCLVCGYRGRMATALWTARGGIITLLLCLAGLIPGLLYVIWRWNAPVCPRCGSVRRAILE